jgi:hypothetical protein
MDTPEELKTIETKGKKPIEYVLTDTSRFSNHVVVQHDKETFTLSFFEIQKPILMGSPEEISKRIDTIKSIPAVLISRITLLPEHFKKVISAMKDNLDHFENLESKSEKE